MLQETCCSLISLGEKLMTDVNDADRLALAPQRGFSDEESEVLGDEARTARVHDRDLSDRLGGPEPKGQVASGHYLRELGRRPGLPAALERKLVADAKDGDPLARAQLVE